MEKPAVEKAQNSIKAKRLKQQTTVYFKKRKTIHLYGIYECWMYVRGFIYLFFYYMLNYCLTCSLSYFEISFDARWFRSFRFILFLFANNLCKSWSKPGHIFKRIYRCLRSWNRRKRQSWWRKAEDANPRNRQRQRVERIHSYLLPASLWMTSPWRFHRTMYSSPWIWTFSSTFNHPLNVVC